MENTPLRTNRMPYFNRYQAMGSQVSIVLTVILSCHRFIYPELTYFAILYFTAGFRRVTKAEKRLG